MNIPEAQQAAGRILDEVRKVIDGKPEATRTALTVLLAEGHLLLEDVPGVGKTMLAKALSRSVGGTISRIQFTPDLLPSDVTGVSIYDQRQGSFVFQRGAVFANVVIGDEINRASPKTQSALLEAMAERQVTVDGVTHELPNPFLVVATQNPVEMDGTYALPEAQRDRFLARISLGYPDVAAELEMLRHRGTVDPLDQVRPVVTVAQLQAMIAAARDVFIAPSVEQYLVDLVHATRDHPDLRLGASPRATLHLVRAVKAHALLDGRDFVLPDDVAALAVPVLAHRMLPIRQSLSLSGLGEMDFLEVVVQGLLNRVPVPTA